MLLLPGVLELAPGARAGDAKNETGGAAAGGTAHMGGECNRPACARLSIVDRTLNDSRRRRLWDYREEFAEIKDMPATTSS